MVLSSTTKCALVILIKADGAADRDARAGLLALLGDGPSAVPEKDAASMLRLVSRHGAVLSPAESAAVLGVTRQTLYRWERKGQITLNRVRLGFRRVGFVASDVEREAEKIAVLRASTA